MTCHGIRPCEKTLVLSPACNRGNDTCCLHLGRRAVSRWAGQGLERPAMGSRKTDKRKHERSRHRSTVSVMAETLCAVVRAQMRQKKRKRRRSSDSSSSSEDDKDGRSPSSPTGYSRQGRPKHHMRWCFGAFWQMFLGQQREGSAGSVGGTGCVGGAGSVGNNSCSAAAAGDVSAGPTPNCPEIMSTTSWVKQAQDARRLLQSRPLSQAQGQPPALLQVLAWGRMPLALS